MRRGVRNSLCHSGQDVSFRRADASIARTWHLATPVAEREKLPEDEEKCVLKIARWEKKLREQWPIPRDVERVIAVRDIMLRLFQIHHNKQFGKVFHRKSADGKGMSWAFLGNKPLQERLQNYTIMCKKQDDEKVECMLVAAG